MFLAAEPFPGLVHAGVGEDPAWEVGEGYRHTGTIITSAVCQNSSASRSRLAGAHTPIGSGEVGRNLAACLDITQHSEAAHHRVTAKSSAANKGAA